MTGPTSTESMTSPKDIMVAPLNLDKIQLRLSSVAGDGLFACKLAYIKDQRAT